MSEPVTVYYLDDCAPVRLAAKEVVRCLRAMTGAPVKARAVKQFRPGRSGIFLGLPGHFRRALGDDVPADARWDDALCIQSLKSCLVLTGANPRSVLFAAYRWLEALGARWVRPGKDGEYLPAIAVPSLEGWDIRETPANRHRGIVIEGACSLEHVLEMVEWMPRVRMNAYMLQFRQAAFFWRRWYERTDLDLADPHLLSLEECAALDDVVIDALAERGLLFHRVGHGWTCEALGNHGSGWEQEGPAPEEVRPLIAQVDGVRDWYGGIPINTELCYSNPEARRRFVDEVLNYARAHPQVDVLHLWASDATNNHCECPGCAQYDPSHWYITLLNEISPKLATVAPDMRMVALCYANTMWPPVQVRPDQLGDNLIFMFAPISRCYAHPILDKHCSAGAPLTPFARNQVTTPRANTDYAAMLKAWQRYLPAGTDAFVFDYHFWWPVSKELLSTDFTRLLHADVQQYRAAGLHGMMSCQTQRNAVPTGLPQTAMGAFLWDDTLTPEALEADYFPAAFGPAAGVAQAFLRDFAAATGACGHRNVFWTGLSKRRARLVRRILRTYAPQLKAALDDAAHPVWKRSLKLLVFWMRYQQKLWRAFAARANNNPDAAAFIHEAIAFLQRTERQMHPWIDTPFWLRVLQLELLPAWEAEDKEAVTV
jgi:hypothetical protein